VPAPARDRQRPNGRVVNLVNGTTIVFETADGHETLDFCHNALARHDVLDAKGAACESWRDAAVEESCVPMLSFYGGRDEVRSRLRSAARPVSQLIFGPKTREQVRCGIAGVPNFVLRRSACVKPPGAYIWRGARAELRINDPTAEGADPREPPVWPKHRQGRDRRFSRRDPESWSHEFALYRVQGLAPLVGGLLS